MTLRISCSYFYSKTNKMHQCIKFILFWNDTLHVSDGLSVHHQEFKTVNTATGICQTDTAACLLYMFRTVFPFIIRRSRLYVQQQAYVRQILLLPASKQGICLTYA